LPPTHRGNLEERRPCTVGLTGGLATGKSTVARHFQTLLPDITVLYGVDATLQPDKRWKYVIIETNSEQDAVIAQDWAKAHGFLFDVYEFTKTF